MITGKKVLIVDDVEANRILLHEYVEAMGLVPTLAENGFSAFMRLKQDLPDLILLDLMMPEMDGFQVLDRLKSDTAWRDIPVVIISAIDEMDGIVRCIEAGALDYLVKPFHPALLKARIQSALEVKAAQDRERDYRDQIEEYSARLEEKVQERTKSLVESQLEVINRLGELAELRDSETGQHLKRMSHYSRKLGQASGMLPDECDLLFQASPLHDIGKVGIPDHILLKPGRLDAVEWETMKTHATMGAQMLSGSRSEVLQMAEAIALNHHEKWDGSGYPQGLTGEDIPLVGRIVALCDVFDALTTERPYKRAWTADDATQYIEKQRGAHFSPSIVDAFKSILPEILAIKEEFKEPRTRKGIILFDLRDFLYQGMGTGDVDETAITTKQVAVLDIIHQDLMKERDRRHSAGKDVPTVDVYIPTGDGYYLLCGPEPETILDIAHCIMALLRARGIESYCVAHVGETHVFTDMTGRENATGFDLGLASRLLSLARSTSGLVCSEIVVDSWADNDFFELDNQWHSGTAKDGVEYRWKLALPLDLAETEARFKTSHSS